jgi:hypothetical protein
MKRKILITIVLIAIILLYSTISIYLAWKGGFFIEPQIYNPCTTIPSNITITP